MYLMEVILDFNTLRGIKPQILTPKSYGDHPYQFYMRSPSLPGVFKATLGDLRQLQATWGLRVGLTEI